MVCCQHHGTDRAASAKCHETRLA